MQIIKLDATDSTNSYLKNLLLKENLEDFTVVVAGHQLNGRGQMGSEWQSKPGKNLTFSVLKRFDDFQVGDRFLLNCCVSLAILDVLGKWQIPDLSVKWPNDILSGSRKICGILIENILQNQQIQASVIGIGLNVNQQEFEGLTKASSLKLITGKTIVLEELLQNLLKTLNISLEKLENSDYASSLKAYEAVLFRKDKPSTFKHENGTLLMGFIRGVSAEGKLRIECEDAVFKDFEMKQIQLLY